MFKCTVKIPLGTWRQTKLRLQLRNPLKLSRIASTFQHLILLLLRTGQTLGNSLFLSSSKSCLKFSQSYFTVNLKLIRNANTIMIICWQNVQCQSPILVWSSCRAIAAYVTIVVKFVTFYCFILCLIILHSLQSPVTQPSQTVETAPLSQGGSGESSRDLYLPPCGLSQVWLHVLCYICPDILRQNALM